MSENLHHYSRLQEVVRSCLCSPISPHFADVHTCYQISPEVGSRYILAVHGILKVSEPEF